MAGDCRQDRTRHHHRVREEGKPADANSDDKHAHDLPELIAGGLLFIVGELLSHSMPQISPYAL